VRDRSARVFFPRARFTAAREFRRREFQLRRRAPASFDRVFSALILRPTAMSAPAASSGSRTFSPVGEKRYRVFLSYSHSDTKWARWLMRRLENYRVPTRFVGRMAPLGAVDRRIAPVFRDRDELPTTSDLGETIREALRESATLVVICSPASAQSRWVQEEITSFKRLHGERGVFAFIVRGEPKFPGAADDCFPPALRFVMGADGELSDKAAEVVAADARPAGDGPKLAFVRLVAGLLGVGFDELRQRELQRRNRRLLIVSICSVAGMALTLGLAILAWQARNDAVLARRDAERRQEQAEDVLAFMLGDFRDELKKIGRFPLLDKVGDKAMTYFESLNARDVTDTSLARQAKVLTQIGEIRLDQKSARYADAARSFYAAYARAAALAAKHPQNADMLFERAQAEFWIGFVQWKRRDLRPAAEWLTRYRDSAVLLLQLEGPVLRARREVISGHHNLAILQLDAGHLEPARAALLSELALKRELVAANPVDLQLKFQLADTLSWLASTAERAGDLAEARQRFGEQIAQIEQLLKVEPKTAQWRYKLADAQHGLAIILGITGDVPAAKAQLQSARDFVDLTLAVEPANRRWQQAAKAMRIQQFVLTPADWRTRGAAENIRQLRQEIEALAQSEPQDVEVAKLLGRAWRVEALVRLASGATDAETAVAHALEISTRLAQGESRADLVGGLAEAQLARARIAADRGDVRAAREDCQRVVDLLAPHTESSRDWRLLDPLARAQALLGAATQHQATLARLAAIGFQPVEPWPESLPLSVPLTNND
jgi:hypothetical protein